LRNHAHLETPRREPYTYDDTTMGRVKAAIQLRYKMLPLWYTLFEEYHKLGTPVVRPLFYDFIDDANTQMDVNANEDQLMLGDSVLMHAVSAPLMESPDANVYLPTGKFGGWYDLHNGNFHQPGKLAVKLDMESIPAYARAGTIIPLKSRIRRSSGCMAQDPLTLAVYLTPEGTATGRVYLDDYRSQTYQDGKSFLKVEFEYKGGVLRASSTTGAPPADISADIERIEIYGLNFAPKGGSLEAKGGNHLIAAPVTRSIGSNLHSAVVKVSPWIDLKDSAWSLKVA